MQKTNAILSDNRTAPDTFEDFAKELDVMFADPNQEATARQKLADAQQGQRSVDKLVQEFEIHGPACQGTDPDVCAALRHLCDTCATRPPMRSPAHT